MGFDWAAWANLAIRWLHLVAGIAWIGSSFYFMWLDSHLKPPAEPKDGVSGELWAVHSGGFYQKQKFLVAPPQMPEELHWFKWEAYTTWISGALLLSLIFYVGADLNLIDASKLALEPWQAIAIGLAFLVGGWVVYDLLCRSPLGANLRAFSVVWFLTLTAIAYALTHIFADLGAFMHVGAIIGTVMAANVFFIIIPNQKKMVAQMLAGEA
ncbi:MAG: urate hydroxylase PuuD, partial [Phenylobacterium sp.]